MLASIKRLIKDKAIHPDRFYIFNFHQIARDFESTRHAAGTWTSIEAFGRFIEELSSQLPIVHLAEGLERTRRGSLRGRLAAITFDDGHRGVADLALPLLQRLNVPATLFLNTAYDDGAACWTDALFALEGEADLAIDGEAAPAAIWARRARTTDDPGFYVEVATALETAIAARQPRRPDYLTIKEAAPLASELVDIGLHAHEHHRLSMLTLEAQRRQIDENRSRLAGACETVPVIALPFGRPGDYTAETIRICDELGLVPLLHNGGYNIPRQTSFRRIPSDSRDAPTLVHCQSPRLHRYD